MKKYILYTLIMINLAHVHTASAGRGGAVFGGALAGSFLGSALYNGINNSSSRGSSDTVYYVQSPSGNQYHYTGWYQEQIQQLQQQNRILQEQNMLLRQQFNSLQRNHNQLLRAIKTQQINSEE